MISKDHPKLSLSKQCKALSVYRSDYYYKPKGESKLNLHLMKLMDEHYLEHPYKGVPSMLTWLQKEMGFDDDYYENKINYLFGYIDETDKKISQNSILDFHLAHRTNSEFVFEPKEDTSKLIWKYLSTSNLSLIHI